MNKNLLLDQIKRYISNPSNRIGVIAVFLVILSVVIALATKIPTSEKSDNGYVQQNSVHPDEFFQTTPRLKSDQKIIVVLRGDKIVEITQELDNKGKVLSENEKVIHRGKVRRGNEYLHSGEQLKDGDVISEDIKYDRDYLYKKQKVLQDNQLVDVDQPLLDDPNSFEYFNSDLYGNLKEISSEEKEYNGKKYKIAKYVDDYGNIITRVLDQDGNEISEGTIISDQTILDNDYNKLKRITLSVQGGQIISTERDLRDIENGDQSKYKNGLFHFTKNQDIGLSAKDELEIARIIERRHDSKGKFQIVKTTNQIEEERRKNALNSKKYDLLNQDRDYSKHEEPKTTPTYPVNLNRVLTIDKVIPAVLINEIKSDIPSKMVKAQIEQDIYGSHGRQILIPAGSKAIGEYKQLEDRVARRMSVSWYRIITPSGINIKLEGELSDAKGASGITGEIDRKMVDRYGMAFALSVFNAASQLSVPIYDPRYRGTADSFTREFSQVTGQLIKESLKVMPTIIIPQGSRVNISPMQDIWFKEPVNQEILLVPLNSNKTLNENN